MRVREAREEDWPRLVEIFQKQGFEYTLPSPDKFSTIQVVVDEDGKIVQAVAARKTCELFFLCDKDWGTPQWRLEALKSLHAVMAARLDAQGYDDAHLWMPKELEKSFGRRLMRSFGWAKQLWPSFSRNVRG